MIRRFGAVLIGLALTLPLAVSTVSAHNTSAITPTLLDVWTDLAGDTHVVGTVKNHYSSRHSNIQVTATWATPAESESASVLINNLAPHATASFHIVENDADVSAAGNPALSVSSSANATKPVGGLSLDVEAAALVGNTYSITVTNESGVALTGVRVSGLLAGGTAAAAASSATANLAIAGSAEFDIVFDDEADGTSVIALIAESTSGTYATSWNNYFSDLHNAGDTFLDNIAWLADQGITLGCGNGNFCPKAKVTRVQMALFLDRAVTFADESGPDFGFQDLAGQSTDAVHSINVLADNGVTNGCSTTPLNYCPNASVTRGQMSKFIVTAYGLPDALVDDHFTDDDDDFSEPYNDSMFEAGVTLGCGGTNFCPGQTLTREQMAAFLNRAATP